MKSQIQSTSSEYFRSLNKKHKDMTAEELRIYRRLYINSKKESYNAYQKQHNIDNKERKAAYLKQYAIDNKERKAAYLKQHNIDNKERKAAYLKQYAIDNKDRKAAYIKQYNKTSEAHKLRCWLNAAVKRQGGKKTTWFKHVGCTKEEFIEHIKEQFVEGMTWDNRGKYTWHLDHIHPISKGGSNHYTNIQPLWAKDNLAKGNKIV